MKKALFLVLAVVVLLSLLLLFQKGTEKERGPEAHTVVTTIYPIYFITKRIAGESVNVKRLIGPGSEIHSFSPTPEDMVELDRADLFITLGQNLEPWSEKLAAATDVSVLALEKGLELIHSDEHHHKESKESEHHHGGINPHVWLDFDNDIKMVQMISERLSALYPKQSALFEKRAAELRKRFERLKESYSDGLKECKKDTILVGHDAFGYLERKYGFETESIMGIFAHSKPNAAKLAALSDMVREKGLHYLFVDPIESSKSAEQLANDLDLKLEALYTLGNIPLANEKKKDDMISLLDFDLGQLRKGLECH